MRGASAPACTVVVKSHRPMEHLRMGLLEACLRSVANAFPTSRRLLVMNDAGDGSAYAQGALAAEARFESIELGNELAGVVARDGYTPGHGAAFVLDWALQQPHEPGHLLVTSDDDMLWREGAQERLAGIWSGVRPDHLANLVLVDGLLEPMWAHNAPLGSVEVGAEHVLLRESVPGAAWSLPMRHASAVRAAIEPRFGYDSGVCEALRAQGALLGAVDLCEHIGEDASTHDNRPTRDLGGSPVDRDKWGLR
jgi:hypothetical protein